MSKLAKKPIPIPEGVKVEFDSGIMKFSGKEGNLTLAILPYVAVASKDNQLIISGVGSHKQARANLGTQASLVKNALVGVSQGFTKSLEVEGIGFKAAMAGTDLSLSLGYTHAIKFSPPVGIKISVEKNTIKVSGVDKNLVGQTAAEIRKIRKRDPKLIAFKEKLGSKNIIKNQKLILFTESKETAEYLEKQLGEFYPNQVLAFTGSSSVATREKVIENFDARARFPKDDYRILITTEVLSEGVNLHRSNVVINYDIPWNPTRLMQRVGRINRVDAKFDKVYSFNFFPTQQSNDLIKLKEAAEAKIHAFISMLGADARLLTEGEPVESFELFSRLVSKKTITGEDETEESDLKYLRAIKAIRDEEPDMFEKIKRLPKKSRTARARKDGIALLTYFRKGRLQKFFQIGNSGESEELDFLTAAKLLEAKVDDKKETLGKDFYTLLEKNKKAFEFATMEELPEVKQRSGRDSASQILGILKAVRDFRQYTEDQELYLKKVIKQLEEGGLPKQTSKKALQELQKEIKRNGANPMKILAVLQSNIPSALLEGHIAESAARTFGPREVILSEYFTKK